MGGMVEEKGGHKEFDWHVMCWEASKEATHICDPQRIDDLSYFPFF